MVQLGEELARVGQAAGVVLQGEVGVHLVVELEVGLDGDEERGGLDAADGDQVGGGRGGRVFCK